MKQMWLIVLGLVGCFCLVAFGRPNEPVSSNGPGTLSSGQMLRPRDNILLYLLVPANSVVNPSACL
jgi:hypothetical protein